MTLVAVPIEVEDPRDVATALEQAQQAKSGGADLVEFRIDVLVEHAEGVTAARRLVQESPLPVLLTCRSDAEGGAWRGEETDRVSFLEAVGTAVPTASRNETRSVSSPRHAPPSASDRHVSSTGSGLS